MANTTKRLSKSLPEKPASALKKGRGDCPGRLPRRDGGELLKQVEGLDLVSRLSSRTFLTAEFAMDPESLPRYLALKALMMPRDTNQHGTIFGGVLLSYIDQAGAIGAGHAIAQADWPRQPLVTVGITSVEFHQPVFVGDVLSFWTTISRVGRTSLNVHVEVEAERNGNPQKLTEADVTYVAVKFEGDQRRPVPIRGQ